MSRPDALVESLYCRIYNLALRMILVPEDAEDATQEICLAILRALPSSRGESKIETWALAIASKRLIDYRADRIQGLSFEAYEDEAGNHADPRGGKASGQSRRPLHRGNGNPGRSRGSLPRDTGHDPWRGSGLRRADSRNARE